MPTRRSRQSDPAQVPRNKRIRPVATIANPAYLFILFCTTPQKTAPKGAVKNDFRPSKSIIIFILKQSLGRLLNIRPGEWSIVLLLQLQVFLIIAVLLIAKPAGNAIFLSRFGPSALPYMYILTAVVAAIISTAYAGAMKYFSLLRVNLWSLGICLGTLLIFALLIPNVFVRDLVAIGLYLWVALFGVLAASQFWMMANMVFDIRQAKRLFGPIGAGAIAGGIFGGYAANIVAQLLGIRPLLFMAAACLLPVILISVYVWRRYIRDKDISKTSGKAAKAITERPHKIILQSKHLMLLCGIITMSVITAKLVDYQFSALASERFADPGKLTAFFGFWFSTFNVIGLLIQLMITQRVVQRVGISGALLVLPAGLSLGAFLMFFVPGLGAATFSRLIDGSLKQSLHRAGVEMLFLPVNKEIKSRIKTYIDVLIDSAAGGIGGLLLLLLAAIGVNSAGISWLVLAFSMGWLVCVLMVREEYLDAFREQLKHLRPRQKTKRLESRYHEVLAGFLQVLEEAKLGKNEQQVLYVLDRADDLADRKFQEPISSLLSHKSGAIRARALHSLCLREGPNLLMTVIPMLNDADDSVKNAALEYLVTHHLSEAEELIVEQLKDPKAEVGGTALLHVLLETKGNPILRRRLDLEVLFEQRVEELTWLSKEEALAWRFKLLTAAGRSGSMLGNDYLKKELNSSEPDVIKAAILATGESLQDRWIFPLIDYLSEAEFRPYATEVLVQYGKKLVVLLPRFLKEDLIDIEDLRRLPRVLKKINSQRTVHLLFSFIEKFHPEDLELRLEVLKALNRMQVEFPDLKMPAKQVFRHILKEAKVYRDTISNLEAQTKFLTLCSEDLSSARMGLLVLLRKRQEGNMDRMFRLMGLRYPPSDIIPVYRGLKAADHSEKINALEFLDIIIENDLKKLVIPLIEYGIRFSAGEESEEGKTMKKLEEEQFKNFRKILKGRDIRLKLAVIHLLGYLGDDRYLPMLERFEKARDKRVMDMAGKALGRLGR